MKRLAIGLALSMWACGGQSASPTSPGAAAPRPTYTVSGIIFAATPNGLEPVDGVRVRLEGVTSGVGTVAGSLAATLTSTTDAAGLFTISGVFAGSPLLWATKGGYTSERKTLTISADTQLDIRVVKLPTYTLSGVVFETTPAGQAPIEGVEVYCDGCGEFGHTGVYTDARGFYSFPWVYAGVTPLFVTKEGYRDPVGLPAPTGPAVPREPGWRGPTVDGDTRFDIELVRR